MVTYILCERRYCLFDDSEHKEHQNRLLINNCYQITYSLKINRQIYSATPPSLCNIKCALHKKSTTPYPNTRNSFSCAPSCHKNFFLDKTQQTFVCLLRAPCRAHMVSARKHSILPRHCSRNFNEKHLRIPLSKTCFSSKNHTVFISRKCTSKMQMAAVCALGY